MSSYIERFRDYVRHTDPYTWATRVASFGLVATLLFGLVFLVPKADAGSIQAGLTIIAEILGVVLGAVLVVTVLLIEQRQQGEEQLRCVLPKYRRLIESSIDTVNAAREELVERVRGGKIQLDGPALVSPVSGPSSTKFRDLATAVSALTFTFSEVLVESKSQQVEDDLTELGYSNDEMIDIVCVRGYSAQIDPEEFLRLVDQALDVTCLQEWSSDEFIDLALRVFEEYERDGVHSALSRFERSQGFLRSKTLVAGAIVPTSTIVSAILAIFGTTPLSPDSCPHTARVYRLGDLGSLASGQDACVRSLR